MGVFHSCHIAHLTSSPITALSLSHPDLTVPSRFRETTFASNRNLCESGFVSSLQTVTYILQTEHLFLLYSRCGVYASDAYIHEAPVYETVNMHVLADKAYIVVKFM